MKQVYEIHKNSRKIHGGLDLQLALHILNDIRNNYRSAGDYTKKFGAREFVTVLRHNDGRLSGESITYKIVKGA